MNYTQPQIDRANAVSLEDFLRTQGETLIKSGREYRWKEHDSLTVRGNKWFRHSQSKGGYPIDFVMEFYGKSFPEAVQLLTLPFLAHGRISAYRFGLCRQTQHCAALRPRKYPRKEEKPQQAFC